MENTPLEPNEELMKVLGDIDFVSIEETKIKRGRRSSILKKPKKSEDDIEKEDTGAKSMGARRRVSFADKLQVMEMNTGNIYDISDGKVNSPSNKDVVQNEATSSESNPDVCLQEVFSSLMDTSSIGLPISSSTEIIKMGNEGTSTAFLTKKHSIDSECDLQPERKKISTEHHHQKSEPDFAYSSDISEFKNVFNAPKNFTLFNEGKLDTELACNQNSFLNRDSLQSHILDRYIGDENKLPSDNYSLSEFDKKIQRMNMLLQSDSVQWGEKDRSVIKDALKEFESRDSFFTVFEKEKSLNITGKLPNVDLYPVSLSNVSLSNVSLSNVPLSENKENLFVDMKSKSILCTNVRQLMLKDTISQISQDVKNPVKSHISNQVSKIGLSEVNSQDSEKGILGQILSEDRSNTDKTCIFNHSMDLTCVSDMNVSNNSEYSEEVVCKDYKLNKKGMFHSDKLNKTVFDSSQYMDLTFNPQNLTAMQDSVDGSINDISSSEPARLTCQQNEDLIHKNSFCYQFKDDKTVFNTSQYMDLTCHPQNETVMQELFDSSAENALIPGPTNLKLQQKEDIIAKISFSSQHKNNKTIFNTSQYMDLTCHPQNVTVMQESFDSSAEDVFIPGSTNLKLQQKEDIIAKNSFSSQHKENKTIFDTSDHMDLTCNLQNRTSLQISLDDSGKNVSEPPVLMSKQNENVTLKDCYQNECKNNKTVFVSSNYTDLNSNLKDAIKAVSELPENSMENVSESSKLTTRQNDNITDKYKTVFDTCYMDLTCNPQDLRSIGPNSPEYSVKDVSVLKPLKQSICQSNEITLNNDKNQLDSSEIDLTCLQGSRAVSVGLSDNMKNVSAQSSRCVTQEDNEVFLPKKQKKDVKDIRNIDKNEENVADILYHKKTQIPCVEKKFSGDYACSFAFTLKSTSVPPEGEHLIANNNCDKEDIMVFSDASIPNQIQNRKEISVLNDLVDDQEMRSKSDFANCMGVTGNVKGLRDNLSESHKNRFNLAFGSDFAESSKEYDKNFHEPFTVKQDENMELQNCALEIASSSMCTKNKCKDTEMPFASADILKSQTDKEILNTSLKNQSKQKLKDFGLTENASISSKNKNVDKGVPNLPEDSIAKATYSFPSAQNRKKLGNYMFVKTDAGKSQACEKVDAYKGEKLDDYNPNLILCAKKSNSEFEKETSETFTLKGDLFKSQCDTEDSSAVLFEENSKKLGENVVRENTKESPFSSKVENKADEKSNSDKINYSVSVEIPNKIFMNETKEDNFPNCKGNMANDVKFEQDKCKYSSDPDILYAIKQIKGMNQPVLNDQNVLKFPEVFLSVKKKSIPPKPPFSCSSIQFSKAIRECSRRSSNAAGGELSFTSDFKHNILSKHNYIIMNSDQNLPRSSENPCDSEPLTRCDIPSISQVLRSATKIVQKEASITYAMSPKQIQGTEETIPQIFKESSNLNQTLDDLDSLKRSLNFDNEVTTTFPKIVVSSCAEEISDFAKNRGMFFDNSELLQENCSISLVLNDDSFDDKVSKQNSKLDASKSSIPNEILSSERKSMGNKEIFSQILQHEIGKDIRNDVFLDNSDVERKSDRIHELEESGKGLVLDNSLLKKNNSCQNSFSGLKKSFDSDMFEDQKREANTTKESLNIERQNVIKPLSVSNFETNKESCESVYFLYENKSLQEAQSNISERLQLTPKDKPKEGHNSSGIIRSQCLSESNKVLEIANGKKNLLKKELESLNTSDFSSDTLKRKCNNENNIPFKESNKQELKQNYTTATSMEVDENPRVYAVSETNVDQLILDKSKLSNQVENIYHDSFVEKENNCILKQKFITEVTIIEKHFVVDKLENEVYSATPSKLLKVKNNEENCDAFVTAKQNPYLLQGNLIKNTKLSVSNPNEQSVDNSERLKNNGNNSYINKSVVQKSFELLKNEIINDDHQPTRKMSSEYSTDENQIIKKVTNNILNKSIKSSSTEEIPNTSLLSKTKNIDNQCKQDNPHKQDSSVVNTEIAVSGRLINQDKNSKSQNCPLNLTEGNGKSLMFVNEGNLGTTKKCESKVTKRHKNLGPTKNVGENRKKGSSSSHNSGSQLEKKYPSYDHTEIQAMNKKDCSPMLDAGEKPNMSCENDYEKIHTLRKRSCENDYEKIHTLRKKLNEASEKSDCLWSLREMDDKQSVFEILPESIFACYLMYVPFDLNAEASSSTKISFKHLKSETDARDEIGFLLFKYYATSEIILSTFSTDEVIKTLSKLVDYALLAKSFIKDIWFVAIKGKISIDISQEIPKLTVKVLNKNSFSLFNLTFAIELRSYPREKIIPEIEFLGDDNELSSETILNAVKEIEPGKYYLSNMVEAAQTVF